ncbi:MAG TPA: sensor histidine kinase, partial [Spirochaetia bacterium]|nr:sensor histidine kinase [Spirochaetia bacterium]
MEAAKVTDEGVRRATENSIRRIHAMALVHETLYQHEPLHAVDLEKYMHNLIGSLRGTLTPENEIEVDAGGSLFVDPDFAIPFGLVLSELVTNSVRHAFPDNRRGTVRVVLRIADRVDLTVSDDGVGFAKDFSLSRSASLGLQIVNSLVNQLSGRIELVPATPGASWLLSFPRAEIPSNLPAR